MKGQKKTGQAIFSRSSFGIVNNYLKSMLKIISVSNEPKLFKSTFSDRAKKNKTENIISEKIGTVERSK